MLTSNGSDRDQSPRDRDQIGADDSENLGPIVSAFLHEDEEDDEGDLA